MTTEEYKAQRPGQLDAIYSKVTWKDDVLPATLIWALIVAVLVVAIFTSSCTPIHKVAHFLKLCQPNQELAAEYACRTYGFCGANAGLIIVGDAWTFTSDWRDNKARWVAVESLPHEIMDCK